MLNTSRAGRWARTALALATAGCAVGMLGLAGCNSNSTPLTPQQKMELDKADPQMQAVLDQLHKDGGMSFSKLTVEQARNGPTAQQAAMEIARNQGKEVPEPVGGVTDMSMTGRDGNNITLKTYWPQGNGPFAVLVYYHGGGWVVGSVLGANPYDASCRQLCNRANCVVVEVDYRLAPENPYPAAVHDCFDAYKYVMGHADAFKSNGKVAVGGESAGGNLAVAVGLMAKDTGTPMPSSILSVYPVGGWYTDTPSARENYNAIPLDTPSLSWFYEKYITTEADRSSRYFDIDHDDLSGLPPTTVITAQIDPLRSDGQKLVEHLRGAGVETRYMNYDGVTHEFFGMGAVVDTAKQAELFGADGLRIGWGMQPLETPPTSNGM